MTETAEADKATTAIQTFRGGSLGHADNLWKINDLKGLVGIIGRCFPGDLTNDRRDLKTRQLVEQAIIHVTNSRAMDKIVLCTGGSIVQTLADVAALDLSLIRALGEGYMIPYGRVCQLMVGYRGFIKLMVNTGGVVSIQSELVYEGEEFSSWTDEKGNHWRHEHKVELRGNAQLVKSAYAIGWTRVGPPLFEAMNKEELDHVMSKSKMAGQGPNIEWTTEMYRKAPIRRIQKKIPKTGDNQAHQLLLLAIEHDNAQYVLDRNQQAKEEHGVYLEQQTKELTDRLSGEATDIKPKQFAEDGQEIPDSLSEGSKPCDTQQ